ncbi:cupin domain-containing protein [Nocardia tengchongensis]|uniref:cupin domain-containing protein n=1 Tax=Nocardia tengchongensis TaxID=2055889 RepID=UPI0036757077
MTSNSSYTTSTVEAGDYEPFLVAGEQCGEVNWLRTEGSDGSTLATGLWRSHAQTFDYPFEADETILVLEGVLVIDFGHGRRLTLNKGDLASFVKGTVSNWTVSDGFKKFFVVSG